MSTETYFDKHKCPGCKGDLREINDKCINCIKRLHWYRYNTVYGLRESFDPKEVSKKL
jgi:predicted amidophosphoribosyltransferase